MVERYTILCKISTYNSLIYMTKKKIIFLKSLHFDSLLFKKLDFQKYIDNKKIETEFWRYDNHDAIKDLKVNEMLQKRLSKENELGEKLKKFSNFWDFFKLLRTTNKDCYIYDIDFLIRNPFFSLLLKLFGARLIFHGHANFPIVKLKKKEIKQKIKEIPIRKYLIFFSKFIAFISKKITNKLVKPKLDIFFYNGDYEKILSNKISKKGVSLFTRDYEQYLSELKNNSPRLIEDDYILFLDQGYPVPYDNYFSSEDPVTTEEKYKSGMINFLKSLGQFYKKKKIIVALHPNSSRDKFYDFKSFKGYTNHLVRHSSLVVGHDSISLQFVALWKKPCLLIYNQDMISRFTKKVEIEWFKDNMSLESLNIDNFNTQKLAFKLSSIESNFDKNRYDTFVNKFLRDRANGEKKDLSKTQLIIDEIIHHH